MNDGSISESGIKHLDKLSRHFSAHLQQFLNNQPWQDAHLKKATYYACEGGKRLRPLLVYASGALWNVDLNILNWLAGAVECIHCYSLVHDDLPAMDNDDYRRGQLSCHKAFGEATAILVGDGLQSLAFAALVQAVKEGLKPSHCTRMLEVLTHAAGFAGMVGGQQLDLHHKEQVDLSTQSRAIIHQLKTGCLIEASVKLSIIAAEQEDTLAGEILTEWAALFGLAFQLQDDLQDIEQDQIASLQKQLSYQNKAQAEAQLKNYLAKMHELLTSINLPTELLHQLMQISFK